MEYSKNEKALLDMIAMVIEKDPVEFDGEHENYFRNPDQLIEILD
jgi:hypothetical protein